MIDSSSSIYILDFEKQIEFVQALVKTFNIGPDTIHVAALKFGHEVTKEFYFKDVENAHEASERIGKITHAAGQSTFTHSALEAMRMDLFSPSNGARTNVPKVCVLLTDGQSTQATETLEQARLAKAAGITIVAVGIGSKVNDAELKAVVSSPASENYVHTSSFDDLKEKLYLFGKQACEIIETTAAPTQLTTSPNDQKDRPDETCQGKEADVLFVVDMSSSIWGVHFQQQLKFLTDVVSFFDIGKTRVGMVTFSNNSRVEFYFDDYKTTDDISRAILAVKQEGGITNTHLALQTAYEEMFTIKHGSRRGVAHICIVITDGVSRLPQNTIGTADLVHKSGVEVFAIGVGNEPDVTELRYIASRPEFVFQVNGYGALSHIENILAVKACEDTSAPPPQTECRGVKEDVVFVVDMSNSIWVVDFKRQLEFLSQLVALFDVKTDKTRVGMVTFSTDTKVQFYLDTYDSQEKVRNAILAVKQEGGVTNTHLALQKVRKEMLSEKHGSRPDVSRVCIVLTDGISRKPKLTAAEAGMIHSSGADVITIGVGSDVDKAELSNIASKPEYVFEVSGYDTLDKIRSILAKTTCGAS